MNRIEDSKAPNDGLDGLLGAYFRAEMPQPWPAFDPSRPKLVPARRERTPSLWASYSKFALAASLAVLLAGGWMLSGKFGFAGGNPWNMGAPTGSPKIFPPMPKDKQPKAEKPVLDLDDMLKPGK